MGLPLTRDETRSRPRLLAAKRPWFSMPRARCRPLSLQAAHEQEDNEDNQDDAKKAYSAVAKSVAVSPIGDDAASSQSAEEQQDQEDDQDDSQRRHRALLRPE